MDLGSCSECEDKDVIIKKARKSYCRKCWKYRCEFQFRKRLFEFGRPAKGTVGEVFRPAEQVLICYDGSPSSVALINLALNALVFGKNEQNESSSTKLPFPFKFSVFVILESELNGSPGVEGRQKQHLESLLRWTKNATKVSDDISWPLLVSCMEMSLKEFQKDGVENTPNSPLVVTLNSKEDQDSCQQTSQSDPIKQLLCSDIASLGLPFDDNMDKQLSELRNSLKTKTEDKDFVNILKRNIVHTVAEQLNISKVLLPEDQTSLAVKMFAMMSLGRGCQVADEMSFTSNTNNGIVLARPLVDFSDVDLKAYLQTLSEECTNGIASKGPTNRKVRIDSVERQCDDFITNLQKGYPATVSTLTRIGSKLQSTSNQLDTAQEDNQANLCNYCQFCKRQCESDSSTLSPAEGALCYGCQHFVNEVHPEKREHFRKLLCIGKDPIDNS